MVTLEVDQSAQLLSLLANIRNLSVPECVRAGDELAFIARREYLVDNAVAIIEGRVPTNATSAPVKEIISVNQQELANNMIQNTFDQHKNLLRKRIRQLECEIERWKEIAALANAPGPLEVVKTAADPVCSEMSSPETTSRTPDNSALAAFLVSQREWVDSTCGLYQLLANTKHRVIVDAFFLESSQSIQQCKIITSSATVGISIEEELRHANQKCPPEYTTVPARAGTTKQSERGSPPRKKAAQSTRTKQEPKCVPRSTSSRAETRTPKRVSPTTARFAAPTTSGGAADAGADGGVLYSIASVHLGVRTRDIIVTPASDRRSLPSIHNSPGHK